jgi:hypothetical protein
MRRANQSWLRWLVVLGASGMAPEAWADTANFELSGKIYTKWLYKNDDTRGCLSLSNPFWQDNIGGGNGVCSEFQLDIKGRVSKYVVTGVRVKSRFGALWQDWWENGDIRWDFPNDTKFWENTSGESLGLNHAAYMKLRGAYIRAALPIPTVRWVHFGASDFGMFNEWTIGKSRYIDRDNGNGVFFEGEIGDGLLKYHTAAVALPKLYVGPRWNTGLKDADPLAGFWGADWAYAAKLASNPIDDLSLNLVGIYISDWEADRNDPDKLGDVANSDHAVDLQPRFQAVNSTLEAQYAPSDLDWLSVTGLVALGYNRANEEYATNAVANDQGFSPVLYLRDADGNPTGAQGAAGTLRVELFDPLEIGLSAKFEYFNIGQHFNALFGARREADVLLTDGFLATGFISGGQLPTLNLANEFVDFDEPWFESIIGWHGGTGVFEYVMGGLKANAEYTFLTYNTNAQGRDTDTQYPDFLYTDGFTDVQAFTADKDYANIYDRGRDARSVYAEYKDRRSHIAVLNGEYLLPFGNNFVVRTKLKWIHDQDKRNKVVDGNPAPYCLRESFEQGSEVRRADCDDYKGDLYLGFLGLSYQMTDELKTSLGYEFQYWNETNRSGSQEAGFRDYDTRKHTGRFAASYNFGGLTFGYLLEYLHKDQERDSDLPGTFDQSWRVWRSKATVEAGW